MESPCDVRMKGNYFPGKCLRFLFSHYKQGELRWADFVFTLKGFYFNYCFLTAVLPVAKVQTE